MMLFTLNYNDFSMFVNELKVEKSANYNAQTNAAGNTVVDLINHKRIIEVGIIPVNANDMARLLAEIEKFSVQLSFLNPNTGELESDVNCIIPQSNVEYYTVRDNKDKTLFKAFNLKFQEL